MVDTRELDMLRDDRLASGWIDPDGRWYGCRKEDHDKFLYLVLGLEVKDAERLGWVRVCGAPEIEADGCDYTWCCGDGWGHTQPTAAQRNRLLLMGHALNDPSEFVDESDLIEPCTRRDT